MKINHLNLAVTDPVAAQQFLVKYFGLKPHGKPNATMVFLTDDNGSLLSLMIPKLGGETEVRYPAIFHVGFMQESEERVNEINQWMKADGLDVPAPARQHGSWSFYIDAPGGFTIEVQHSRMLD